MNRRQAATRNSRLTRIEFHSGRSAFTLLELILVLVLTTSLLAGTVALISVVQRSSERSKSNLLLRREIRRFADDFRRDFNAFPEREISDNEIRLLGSTSDQSVTYRIQTESSVTRVAQKPDDAAPANDQYVFGDQTSINFERLENIESVQWTLSQSDRPDEPIQILASARERQ